jgi:hypothetical protein
MPIFYYSRIAFGTPIGIEGAFTSRDFASKKPPPEVAARQTLRNQRDFHRLDTGAANVSTPAPVRIAASRWSLVGQARRLCAADRNRIFPPLANG